MKSMLRKITSLSLAFMLIFVSVFGSAGFVYAGGVEDEEGVGSGQPISSATFNMNFKDDGYYPATFRYMIQNLTLTVTFENGSTEQVRGWYMNNGGYTGNDYAFVAYGNMSHDQYYLRLYDNATLDADNLIPAKFSENEVQIGSFQGLVTRNNEKKPLEGIQDLNFVIRDPKDREQDCNNNVADFKATYEGEYEETWFPLSLEAGKEYTFTVPDWQEVSGTMFAGIWFKDNIDRAVWNLGEGLYPGDNSGAFTYTPVAGEKIYLVVGEVNANRPKLRKITWKKKEVLKSVELKPASSYAPWKHELENMQVKLTYKNGTSEIESNWVQGVFRPSGYDYDVDGYVMTTTNGDKLCLSKYVNGTWEAGDHYGRFAPGSYNWRVVIEDNAKIYDDATVKVTTPSASKLKLEAGYGIDFTVSETKSAAFTCTPSQKEDIEIVNQGKVSLTTYVYFQPPGTNIWQYDQGTLVHGGRNQRIFLMPGEERLILISSEEGSTSGTIGTYVIGNTTSATIGSQTISQDDYSAWANLPIQFNFTSPEGKSAGSQTVSSWRGEFNLQGAGVGETKFDELVYYQVFKNGKPVDIPFISEEMLVILNEQTDDQVKDMILLECGFEGGVKGLKLPTGTYTVKAYLNQPVDKCVIGTGTVKVVKPACKTHSWNSGKVTKKATAKANGTKTYTCTKCSETKKSTISKIKTFSLSKTSYTYDGKVKNPTVTIKDAKGKKINSKYYTVKKVTKRKAVGKHSYKITFKGDYSGTKTLTFTINPKATSVTKVTAAKKAATVKWKKISTQATGYEIMLATNSKFTKGKKTVKVTSYKTTTKKVTKLTAKKKYWVKVRTYKTVSGKKYYSAWSKTKTVTTK